MTDRLVERMLRAARIETAVYEEVEGDRGLTAQALLVVVLSSLAAGIGISAGIAPLILSVVVSVLSWYVWAFLTYWIGTRLLPEPQTSADHGELLRVLGYASAPGIVRVLGVIPFLRGPVFLVAAVWMLIAGVVAVRHALDYASTLRAILVVLVGWIVQWFAVGLVLWLVGVRG